MKVFYHNDPDGLVSAFLITRQYQTTNKKIYEMDYNTEFPLKEIEKNEKVYILDYSIKPDIMRKLLEKTKDVVWIDHHKSSIETYNKEEDLKDIEGIRFDGIAACMLTQLYLNNDLYLIKNIKNKKYLKQMKLDYLQKKIFRFVWLTSDWDTFDMYDPYNETIPFIYGFNSYNFIPLSKNDVSYKNYEKESYLSMDEILTARNLRKLIEDGKIILRNAKVENKKQCETKGFEVNVKGYKCFALNSSKKSSLTFEDLENKSDYDAFIVFSYNGNKKNYEYSIYTDKPNVDCSLIAKEYGGGGHKQASGFVTKDLIFN